MPLLTCPDCEGRVSDVAPACPHCGLPAEKFISQALENRPNKELADAAGATALGFGWVALAFTAIAILLPPTTVPASRHKGGYPENSYAGEDFEAFWFLGRFFTGRMEWGNILWPLWIVEIVVGVGITYFLMRKKSNRS